MKKANVFPLTPQTPTETPDDTGRITQELFQEVMAKATDAIGGGMDANDKDLAEAFKAEILEFKEIKIGIMVAAVRAGRNKVEKEERRKVLHQEKWEATLVAVKDEPGRDFNGSPLIIKGSIVSPAMIGAAKSDIRRSIKKKENEERQKNLRTTVRNFFPNGGKPGVGSDCQRTTGKTARKREVKEAAMG